MRFFSFLRKIIYAVFFIILVSLVLWYTDHQGVVRVEWLDSVIETSVAVLIVGVFGFGYLFYCLFRLWSFLRHGPERWRLRRHLKKFKEGHDYFTKGLIAIASGDASEAGVYAIKSRKLLGNTPLTQLLQAQAAQLAGDRQTAVEIFQSLTSNPDCALLGYRGLIMEARRANNWEEVAKLTKELSALKPNTPWLHYMRFELLARQQNWNEAMIALSQVSASGLLEATRAKHNRAALLTASSQQEAKEGHAEQALQLAEKAVRETPHWLPAVLNLAERLMTLDHRRAAVRLIEKNWPSMPHPELAKVYATGAKDALDAFKKVELLCRDNINTPISHYVLGEASLAAEVWGEARRHFTALVSSSNATQSTYRMLARLERLENGDDHASSQWMIKAADAALDPTWLCHNCGGSHASWQATCSHCGSFNELEWQSPGKSRVVPNTTPRLTHGWMD